MTTAYCSDLVAGEEIPPEDEECPNHIEPDPDESGVDTVPAGRLYYARYVDPFLPPRR